MKYLIRESKLYDVIYKYFDEKYDNLTYKKVKFASKRFVILFFTHKYEVDKQVFTYFSENTMGEKGVLAFHYERDYFDSIFSDLWIPIFKEWFFNTYGYKVNRIV
jgi:hypothetical protein